MNEIISVVKRPFQYLGCFDAGLDSFLFGHCLCAVFFFMIPKQLLVLKAATQYFPGPGFIEIILIE